MRLVPKVCQSGLLLWLFVSICGCNLPREYEAALLLSDIAAGSAGTRYKATRPEPVKVTISFIAQGRRYSGDLYTARGGPQAALLLLPGAAETGKDDPRLQALARSMARARFAVFVPDLARFRTLQIGGDDINDVVNSFHWLASRRYLTPGGAAGICAFSYACGPAVLAAIDPLIRDRVSFVMTVGGYHDLTRVLTFFTTGYFRKDNEWLYRVPNHYGKWVFVLSNINRLRSSGDRALFRTMAGKKLDDPGASIASLAAGLSAEGKTLYAFLENRDPTQARSLIQGLPVGIKAEIQALNVAEYDLRRLQAAMIILHGYDDDIIPYTESIALASRLPEDQRRLYLIKGLMHVELQSGIMDHIWLWRALSALLEKR